jgi:hypothetical protein
LRNFESSVPNLDVHVLKSLKQEITDEMQIHLVKQRVAIEKTLMIEIDKKTTRKRIENMLDPIINLIFRNYIKQQKTLQSEL